MNYFLPIETINRELDFKLALAVNLANGKRRIFVGSYHFLDNLWPKFKNGIYVGKNIFDLRPQYESYRKYHRIKARGVDIIYLHEEGGVFGGQEEEWRKELRMYYNVDRFEEGDIICTWGEWQRQADLDSATKPLDQRVTGHPRFDLYKHYKELFLKESESIKKRFGDYILVNSNYGYSNHGRGIIEAFKEHRFPLNDIEKRKYSIDFFFEDRAKLMNVIKLIHHLAIDFPERNFVIRPHPSESHKLYHDIFGRVKNVHIVHEGAVGPWILASKVMIHDGCTTAIEARLSGIPVINYKSLHEERFDLYLANQMGRESRTVEETHKLIEKAYNEPDSFYDNMIFPEKAISLLENLRSDSFDILLNVIEEKEKNYLQHHQEYSQPSAMDIRQLYMKKTLKTLAHRTANFLLSRKYKTERYKYNVNKFRGLDKRNIAEKLEILQQKLGKSVTLKYYNDKFLEIN